MKKVRSPKVGDLVRVPVICFDSRRSGWNGWIFRTGRIESLYTSKTGRKCAEVKYCSGRAGRYQLLPCTEHVKGFVLENVFQYDERDLAQATRIYKDGRAEELAGESVCWDEDLAFLVNNGYIETI